MRASIVVAALENGLISVSVTALSSARYRALTAVAVGLFYLVFGAKYIFIIVFFIYDCVLL